MKRRLTTLALTAGALVGLLAGPAGQTVLAASSKCPGIISGSGTYTSAPGTPSVTFTIGLGNLTTNAAVAGCRKSTYTIVFEPTDSAGNVIAGQTLTYAVPGDGTSTTITSPVTAMPGSPAGVCVYATVTSGHKQTDYAPAGGGCQVNVLDGGSGGTPFRG